MFTIDHIRVFILLAALVGSAFSPRSVARGGDASSRAGGGEAYQIPDETIAFGEIVAVPSPASASDAAAPEGVEFETIDSEKFEPTGRAPMAIGAENPPGGGEPGPPRAAPRLTTSAPSQWHLLPTDLLFHSFIAGVHAPRMGGEIVNDNDQGALLDVSIGSRLAIARFGTVGPGAEGVELQVYGAAFSRLSMDRASDVEATDYKFGVPIVFKHGSTSHQIGYDHLSSHIGDEFLIRYPNYVRRNYVRDAIRYAIIQDVTQDIAMYADINRAFHTSGGAGGWHFQLGAEYEPFVPPGFGGAPVAAVNTQLREEFDFEGNLGLVLGWQWRGAQSDDLMRLGLSVYSGRSRQFSFYDQQETLIGAGLWYDF